MLNILSSLGVLVLKDEMHLVCRTTLVRTKHNCVRSIIVKFLGVQSSNLNTDVLKISTSTLEAILKPHFKLQNNCPILQSNRGIKLFDYGIFLGWLANKEAIVFMAITLGMLPNTCMADYINI
jgi:hypothetical protein